MLRVVGLRVLVDGEPRGEWEDCRVWSCNIGAAMVWDGDGEYEGIRNGRAMRKELRKVFMVVGMKARDMILSLYVLLLGWTFSAGKIFVGEKRCGES